MRKLLYTFAALAGMLAVAASCQRETPVGSSPDGDLIDVSMNFTVDDGRPATKAIGDGLTANKLTFLAYDEKGNYLSALLPTNSGYENLSSKAGTVNLKVVKGMKYQFVMLATAPSAIGSYYTVDAANKTLAVNYSSIATAQKEDSDFFYFKSGVTSFTASGESKTATLKRPLAQLNVGSTAEDFAVATNSGINTNTMQTGYVLKGIPNQLSLLDGNVSGSVDVTLNTATRPSAEDLAVSGTNYKWVAMAYVLMSEAGQTADVTLNVEMTNTSDEALSPISRAVTSVPLKRNYRTNILGNIFSIDAMFNVSVDSDFTDNTNKIIGPSYASVAALNAYFETFANNADNGDVVPEVVTLTDIPETSPATITLPKYAGNVQIRITAAYTGTVKVKYADSGDQPAHIDFYAANLHELETDIDNSHLTILSGSVIETGNFRTGSSTLEIMAGAKVGTANIQKGNAEIAGEVTNVTVVTGAVSGDAENTKVQISLAPEAQVTNIELNAASDVVVEQPKGNIADVTADTGDSNPTRNNVKVVVAEGAAGSTATALNDGSIYLVAKGDVLVTTATDESAAESDSPSVYVVSVEDDVTVATDEEKDGQVETAAGAEVTPIIIPEEDTYYITTASKLVWVVSQVYQGESFEGKTVILSNDINLQDVTIPASYGSSYTKRNSANLVGPAFKGTFDGNGKTISNLSVSADKNDEDQAVGLFGGLDGAVVKDVNFVNVTINGGGAEQAGVVAGLMTGGSVIENVKVLSGTVISKNAAGGMAGRILVNGIIRSCENKAPISTTGYNAGGMTGIGYYDNGAAEYNQGNTRIENCVNNGVITAGTTGAGGIAGLFYGDIVGCTNNATVTGSGTSIGGILGEAQSGAVIDCINNGAVTNNGGSGAYGTGGIVGWIRSSYAPSDNFVHAVMPTVSGCTNNATVAGGSDAGGIVGTVYVTANIEGNTSKAVSITATNFAAGIVANYQKTEDFKSLGLAKDSDGWNAAKLYLTENVLARPETLSAANTGDLVYDNTQGSSVVYSNNHVEIIVPAGTDAAANAQALRNAINTAPDGAIIYLEEGKYEVLGQSDRIYINSPGQTFKSWLKFVGLGNGAEIVASANSRPNARTLYVYCNNTTSEQTVNLGFENITFSEPNIAENTDFGVWFRGYGSDYGKTAMDITFKNVTCNSVIIDNNYVDGDTISLSLQNSEVKRLKVDASPMNNSLNTYSKVTYDSSTYVKIEFDQSGASALSNILVNGVAPTSREAIIHEKE